ncbi:hypothetical protein Q1695_009590 [Nippostrongylus brasiliensis]|nr:hypothetical protein Q1695_009590 [Nippostrongylus brasiliensis]
MQTRSTTAGLKAPAQENSPVETKVNDSPTRDPAPAVDEQQAQQPQQQNTEPWTSSSESLIHSLVQNSASSQNMVRPAQLSSSSVLLNNSTRLNLQLPRHQPLAERRLSVSITPQTKSSKNLDYVVTRTKGGMTLYSKSDLMVPFMFAFSNVVDPHSRIRVRAEYTEERYATKAVERCPNHQYKDRSVVHRQHFVRTEHVKAIYDEHDGIYSLTIPLCDTTSFTFTCFSSCSGGINRRPIQLVFILEAPDGTPQDMCYIALKVCANPLRDSAKEDDKLYDPGNEVAFAGANARKRFNRPVEADFKRVRAMPNYNDPEETCSMYEIHVSDPRKFRKILWFLMHEEKIDQLLYSNALDNPFRHIFMPCEDTPLKCWLSRPEIGLLMLVEEFERRALFTIGDLAKVYRTDLFSRLGFEPSHCMILNKAFQDFVAMQRAIVNGALEMNYGPDGYNQCSWTVNTEQH